MHKELSKSFVKCLIKLYLLGHLALLGFNLTRQLFRLAFVNLGVGRWLGMLNEMDMRMREEFWSKLILNYVHISWVGM